MVQPVKVLALPPHLVTGVSYPELTWRKRENRLPSSYLPTSISMVWHWRTHMQFSPVCLPPHLQSIVLSVELNVQKNNCRRSLEKPRNWMFSSQFKSESEASVFNCSHIYPFIRSLRRTELLPFRTGPSCPLSNTSQSSYSTRIKECENHAL